MAKYMISKSGTILNRETFEWFAPPLPDLMGITKSWRQYQKWLDKGGIPDQEQDDPDELIRQAEYEVMQCRISWQAAKDEKLAIEADLLKDLEDKRSKLASLQA